MWYTQLVAGMWYTQLVVRMWYTQLVVRMCYTQLVVRMWYTQTVVRIWYTQLVVGMCFTRLESGSMSDDRITYACKDQTQLVTRNLRVDHPTNRHQTAEIIFQEIDRKTKFNVRPKLCHLLLIS